MASEAMQWLPQPTSTPLDAALAYAAHGWPVMPLHHVHDGRCTCQKGAECEKPGKHPRTIHGVKDASTDPLVIRSWWRNNPRANVGVAMGGPTGLVALDVDGEAGKAALRAFNLPPTTGQRTGSGGKHLLFIAAPGSGLRNAVKFAPGLDVRTDGGLIVVAPSLHANGQRYAWDSTEPPAALPPELHAAMTAPRTAKAVERVTYATGTDGARFTPNPHRYADAALARAVANVRTETKGGRNNALNREAYGLAGLVAGGALDGDTVWDALAGAARAAGLSEDEITATLRSAFGAGTAKPRKVPELPPRPPRRVPPFREVINAETGEVTEIPARVVLNDPSPEFLAEVASLGSGAVAFAAALTEEIGRTPTGVRAAPGGSAGSVEDIPVSDAPDWREELTLDDKHNPRPTLHNVVVTLRRDPGWAESLAHDERGNRVLWVREPPFDGGYSGDKHTLPREVIGTDHARLAMWMERRASIRVGSAVTAEAVDVVARERTIDPVRDYLDGLAWDGTQRMGGLLHRYMGARDTAMHTAIGRAWMVSAVARTYRPGCQADHVLVLEGDQGIRKSSALRTLVGDEYFADELPDVGSKDAGIQLQGLWVVELAELDALKRSEATRVKAFITRRDDRYRGVFERHATSHPRRCVFAASTNDDTYIQDPTGGRRWWPVRCAEVSTVNLAGLARDRDQLWAEAVAAYRSGEPWHITDPGLAAEVVEVQGQRRQVHPWEAKIAQWCIGRTETTTAAVLAGPCDKPVGSWSKADQMQVSDILRGMGWSRRRVRVGNSLTWCYQAPGAAPADDSLPDSDLPAS